MFKVFLGSIFGKKDSSKSTSSGPKMATAQEAGTVPVPDSQDAYREVLREAMNAAEDAALGKLHRAIDTLPWKIEKLLIGVHLGQDEEGGFNIHLHAAGPDLSVLNKAIQPWAGLFEGRTMGFHDKRANVPMFDPYNLPYPVAETIIEEAMGWVQHVWTRAVFPRLPCPVELFAVDGWTEQQAGPITLARGPNEKTK